MLSGFTRNTSVSLSRATMVPTMPPLVTTLSPVCKSGEHFRRLLPLPLHREKEEEIKDPEDEKDGEESQQGVGGRRRLKKQVENHVINQV